MMNLIKMMGFKAKVALNKFLSDESGEVNVVAIVVLIAVAVVLAILLKDQISGLITNLIEGITTKANTILE